MVEHTASSFYSKNIKSLIGSIYSYRYNAASSQVPHLLKTTFFINFLGILFSFKNYKYLDFLVLNLKRS